MGRGAEQGHVPVSRARSRTAQQLRDARHASSTTTRSTRRRRARAPYFFFSKNDGLQNQSVLYIQKGLDGTPEVLIDPNAWSADGTVRLGAFAPSKDAKYAVYGISQSGSDWQRIQRDGARDEEDAARHDRVGQGVGRRVARRRLLLQPLSRSRPKGKEKAVDQREPPGLLPQASARRSRRTRSSTRTRRTRSASTPSRRPRTSGSRSSTISDRGKGKDGNALFVRDLVEAGAARVHAARSRDQRTTRYDVVDNVGDKLLVETESRARRTGASCSIDPASSRRRRTGRPSCRSSPSRSTASARRAASCSRPI